MDFKGFRDRHQDLDSLHTLREAFENIDISACPFYFSGGGNAVARSILFYVALSNNCFLHTFSVSKLRQQT